MDNYVMIQFFEWYLPADGQHWKRLKEEAPHLREMGVSGVWIPPCMKAIAPDDVGYGTYDWYDLGEFDQKGSVGTKYGTKQELIEAIQALHEHGLKVYADVVLNHKAGADETERFMVVEVDPVDRIQTISEPFEIDGWTKFTFPGRNGQYSGFQYNFNHFTATDYDQATQRQGIFRILGDFKSWSENVDCEFGNYDYLMYADVDFHHPDVIEETVRWGKWLVDTLQLDGFRLDAIKHINQVIVEAFVRAIREHVQRDFYVVGEYWKIDPDFLRSYLDDVNHQIDLFGVALHINFHHASREGSQYDLSHIFDSMLVTSNPMNTATFVESHDTQKSQALESWVEDWFKPLAYAMILLRRDGYPCLFYGDYYGISGPHAHPGFRDILDILLKARRDLAYGEQIDTFDHPNAIAWQRMGDEDHPGSGLAVLISNGEAAEKTLSFGPERAGTIWHDLTGSRQEWVTLDDSGTARFFVNGGSVSVWALKRD